MCIIPMLGKAIKLGCFNFNQFKCNFAFVFFVFRTRQGSHQTITRESTVCASLSVLEPHGARSPPFCEGDG
jgi:hypothetical protein